MEGIENSYGRLFLQHQLPKEVNHLAKTLESIV
ncbi:helicase, partial [Streptococcus pyogenes]